MNKEYLRLKFKTWFIIFMTFLYIILSPIIGKGVDNTTKALLPGLTTEDQISTVADVVDNNKQELINKNLELQATVDKQNSKINEQQQTIEQQKTSISETKIDVVKTNEAVVKVKDCSLDVAKYCTQPQYIEKSKFDKLIEHSIENCIKTESWSKSKCNDYVLNEYLDKFNSCQKAISCS